MNSEFGMRNSELENDYEKLRIQNEELRIIVCADESGENTLPKSLPLSGAALQGCDAKSDNIAEGGSMRKRSAGHAGNKEQTPCGFVTLHTPRAQKAEACASEAQGMRETWQGGAERRMRWE